MSCYKKRPLSADFAAQFSKNLLSAESSDLESIEEEKLPSSKLLKHLLSEPIKSWRKYSNSDLSEPTDQPSTDKSRNTECDTVSLSSDSSTDVKIQPMSKESNTTKKLTPEKNLNINTCLLLPGLTTKPPLPKRQEAENKKLSARLQAQSLTESEKKLENNETIDKYSQRDNNKTDMEKIGISENKDSMYDLEGSSSDFSLKDAILKEPDVRCLFFENSEIHNLEKQVSIDTKNAMVQNWILEDKKIEHDIVLSEKQTDLYLDNIKSYRQDYENEKCNNSDNDRDNDERFRKFFEIQKLEVEPSNETNSSNNQSNQKPTKTSRKSFELRSNNAITKRTSSSIKKPTEIKKKFVATAMRTPKDFTENNNAKNVEEESWMATEEKNKKTHSKSINKTKEELRHANYFDVLSNIEELEKEELSCSAELDQRCILQENSSNINEDCDEIASILQVLEDADKKSRK